MEICLAWHLNLIILCGLLIHHSLPVLVNLSNPKIPLDTTTPASFYPPTALSLSWARGWDSHRTKKTTPSTYVRELRYLISMLKDY
ncbi:hypothetical protein F5X96DRAFT_654887 [Biscogniauxia mediterranea]|nr:hypothetical protein F5X96DRAFT_654887 [Biscogniauxia mediterranea]